MTQEEFEKKIMDKILSGHDEIFSLLKTQYNQASVVSRKFTTRGFFLKFNVPDELSISGMNGTIDDVSARFEDSDMVYMFILFVRDGKIDCLEGVTVLGDWRNNYGQAILQYEFDDGRHHSVVVPAT